MASCDVAVIGAGPYGLSAAAHLRTVKGLEVRLFGEPMSFWDRHMPAGMLLRSPWEASHISDPDGAFTLDAYRSPRLRRSGRFCAGGSCVSVTCASDTVFRKNQRSACPTGLLIMPGATSVSRW